MNVEVFALCREVKLVENSVDIIGIFNRAWSSTIPTRINNGSIAVRLNFTPERDSAGIHTINISVKDDHGNTVEALSDSIKVDYDGHLGFVMDLAYELKNIGLPKFGEYTFNLSVDDKNACFIPLCLLTEKENRPPST
jgi:hypothetical protein